MLIKYNNYLLSMRKKESYFYSFLSISDNKPYYINNLFLISGGTNIKEFRMVYRFYYHNYEGAIIYNEYWNNNSYKTIKEIELSFYTLKLINLTINWNGSFLQELEKNSHYLL